MIEKLEVFNAKNMSNLELVFSSFKSLSEFNESLQ